MQVARYTASITKRRVRYQGCPSHCATNTLCAADPMSLIDTIHGRNMKAGVAISPDTPSTAITDEVAEAADMLLVMTVYPGTIQDSCYAIPLADVFL